MSKNFTLCALVLFIAFFAACRQPNPTQINSTQHQNEKPKAPGNYSSTNTNGSVKTEEHNTTSRREPTNTAETKNPNTNH